MKTFRARAAIWLAMGLVHSPVWAQTIVTVAGTGVRGFGGDGGSATNALLNTPYDVALDRAGNIFIADYNNTRIRRVDTVTGVISTIAGTGVNGFSGDNGPATNAKLTKPAGVFSTTTGDVLIADTGNNRVRRVVGTTGTISTLAGTGTGGYNGDGILATTARIASPNSTLQDAAGNVYIADYANDRIRMVDAVSAIVSTVAGTTTSGFSGDGGLANLANISGPTGMAMDAQGNLFFSDLFNNRVRKVDTNGVITTIVGTGSATFNGDNIAATNASLAGPRGVAVDAQGRIFIADATHHRIRMVDTNGIISTIAGTGVAGFSGDGGPATAAQFNFPSGVQVDTNGNVFVTDQNNHRIRRFNLASLSGPSLSAGPIPATQAVGGTAFFSVAATGSGTVAYQWQKNGVDIAGAVNATLIIPNVQNSDTGNYSVNVTDSNGTVPSAPAALTVQAQVTLPSGLVAWWKLDEAPGTPVAVDSVGNYNGVMSATGAAFVSGGRAGNALSLTSSANGLVNMGNVLNFVGQDFTVVAWIKTPVGDSGTFRNFLSKHDANTANGYILSYNHPTFPNAATKRYFSPAPARLAAA